MDWAPIFQSKVSEYSQGDQWQLQFDDTITKQQDAGWEQYERTIFARFKCSLCRRTWPSNLVKVIFHFRLNSHQGMVKARAFRQNCKKCTNAPMEDLIVEDEVINILMDNLVKNIRKKCYHEIFDYVPREHTGVEVENPHEPAHCEGCRAGVCVGGAALPNVRLFHGGRGRGGRGRGYRGAWA
ncbi:hypothetical protein NL108_000985 [Boleophthalmus pectinirostris]|nr:hypothetical protein NL108_000985 [Boleophthalmus pectinirostris]